MGGAEMTQKLRMRGPHIECTPDGDTLYVQFRPEEYAAGTTVIDDYRIVDFAEDG
jgi:hypothetical protein